MLNNEKIIIRFLGIFLCCFILIGTKQTITTYFDRLNEKTIQLIHKQGGIPFEGGKTTSHPVWHPILAGLGDFDNTYQFAWNDAVIFTKVIGDTPELTNIMEKKEFYDTETKFYYKRPETLPEYNTKSRDLFFDTIINDPMWYGTILTKRVARIFYKTTPVSINIGRFYIEQHYLVLCIALLIFGFYKFKNFYWIVPDKIAIYLFLSSSVSSLQPLIIFSGKGVTYASWMPLTILLILSWQLHQNLKRKYDNK